MVSVRLQQYTINEINEDCAIKFTPHLLYLIFTAELSPLEPHLPPDITIQLLSMEAACLFLVDFFNPMIITINFQ